MNIYNKSVYKSLLSVAAGALMTMGVAACATTAKNQTSSELSLDTIAQGTYSGICCERKAHIIQTNAAWENLWDKHAGISVPREQLPNVDFDKYTVIAVSSGKKSTGGFRVEITKIVKDDDNVGVYVKEYCPTGDFVTLALTQPYHMVKVDKINEDTKFTFNNSLDEGCPPK